MVALAGSGDVIRSGGGADTARSDLSAPTAGGSSDHCKRPGGGLSNPPRRPPPALLFPAAQSYDDAGNTVGTLDASGTETTVAGSDADHCSSDRHRRPGSVGDAVTTATTVTADATAVSDGWACSRSRPNLSAHGLGKRGSGSRRRHAAATIEAITGLRPLAMQPAPGVPIYAAMIRRGRHRRGPATSSTMPAWPSLSPTSPRRRSTRRLSRECRRSPSCPIWSRCLRRATPCRRRSRVRQSTPRADYVLLVLSAVR